jgi:hypothetical protein
MKGVIIGAILILSVVNMNFYLYALGTGHIFGTHLQLKDIKIWFGISSIVLLGNVLYSLWHVFKKNPIDLFQKEFTINSIVFLMVASFVIILNYLTLITQPYTLMASFDFCFLLTTFIVFINFSTNGR